MGNYYDLKCVITSGAGRWFQNSEVVTNILVLEKKIDPNQPSGDVNFIVLTRPLGELGDEEAVRIAAAQIELGQTQNDTMTIRAISPENLEIFRTFSLGGNAQFVNCDWVLMLPLVPIDSLFSVRRGERRGLNNLFYPAKGHGIEDEYIRPLAKSLSGFNKLIGQATKEAFCCSRTEDELLALGHTGALNWIKRFSTPENITKLGTGERIWYSMEADQLADLVMTINYGERLFTPRIAPLAFADQRLIPLDPKSGVDIELCHALLNSTISMFFIEGMGFGRGLGALDLSKNRIEEFMHLLDPSKLDQAGIIGIKEAFLPLLQRDVMDITDELEQSDRQAFDDAVIGAFNLTLDKQLVYDCLLSLVAIRISANS